jgi:hypothetical protein
VHRSVVVVQSILLDLQISILREKPDLNKRVKILKLCFMLRVR